MIPVLTTKTNYLATVLNAVALLVLSIPVSAQAFDRGEALYKNHCGGCHEELAHTREGSRIDSMDDLYHWVASWSAHSRLDWSSEDVEDVADYLNRKFYHLTDKP